MEPIVGRLAPTPSGQLHLGNVVAFGAAWLSARSAGGRLLLRMEDVDRARARRGIEDDQKRDLEWLGLHWDHETRRQSERDYTPWLAALAELTYHCDCSRAEIRAAGGIYPGTCRAKQSGQGSVRFRVPDDVVSFADRTCGPQRVDPASLGDPALRRRDGFFAYTLAVVADDIADGVTEVVRGADLLSFTAIQIRLWEAFGATPPTWMHSPLVLGADGKKLSKSHGSAHVGALRDAGWSPQRVWRQVLPWLGLHGDHIDDALDDFDPAAVERGPITVQPEDLAPQ